MNCKKCNKPIYHGIELCYNCRTGKETSKTDEKSSVFEVEPEVEEIQITYEDSYIAKIHKVGASNLFLIAIILQTLVFILNLSIPFGFVDFIFLVVSVLPVIAFWVIYFSSKQQQEPDKILTALLFIKVTAIANIVVYGMLGSAGLLPILGGILSIDDWLVFLALVATILVVASAIIFHYIPMLQIIKSINNGIRNNASSALKGIKFFTITSIIGIVFSISIAIAPIINIGFTEGLGIGFSEIITLFSTSRNLAIEILATVTSSGSVIILLIILNRLNKYLIG
ncbi:MAG: hypothetical protein FWE33_03035 [Defluviitaleaceae bacterium]|nr:hypothetical protein [Defluviitaleaceae bacterium]